MTPLFPAENEALLMKQGKVGDCYILASLDCIYNKDAESRELLKSKFRSTKEGVYVKIKRSSHSNNLDPEKLKKKYIHYYDSNTNEDVFFVSNERLAEIDNRKVGVETNSLAVKILISLSSYYYIPSDELGVDPNDSVLAHNKKVRHAGGCTDFVADILGIKVNHFNLSKIDDILKLKQIKPDEPIFIGMVYGKPDEHGRIHGTHALRIDKIEPLADGDYRFHLINPHNTQKQDESYLLSELKKRRCVFSVFHTNNKAQALMMLLVKNHSVETGQYIYQHPELFPILYLMNEKGLLDKPEQMAIFIERRNKFPYLIELYDTLTDAERISLANLLATSKDSEEFLSALIKSAPRFEVLRLILERESDNKLVSTVMTGLCSDNVPEINAIFNRPDFFRTVIDLVKTKSQDSSLLDIDIRLMYYLRSDSESQLSRTAGLRSLFSYKIFTERTILVNFLAYGITETLTEEMRVFINHQFHKEDPKKIFADFLKVCSFQNARSMFVGLHSLSKEHPELVEAFIPLAQSQIKDSFYESPDILLSAISSEQKSEFKTWFLKLNNIPKPQPVIAEIKPVKAADRDLIEDKVAVFEGKNIPPADNETKHFDEKKYVNAPTIDQPQVRDSKLINANLAGKEPIEFGFIMRLEAIKQLALDLDEVAKSNPKYKLVAETTHKLHDQLFRQWTLFMFTPVSNPDRITKLQTECSLAFDKALPVIQEHRGWGQLIVSLISAINTVAVALNLVSKESTGWRFFTPQTSTEKNVQVIRDDMNGMKPG